MQRLPCASPDSVPRLLAPHDGRNAKGTSPGKDSGSCSPRVTGILRIVERLDQALVRRGLCESREKAKRSIMAGRVRLNGQVARKSSDTVRPEDALALEEPERFVSRGGLKLEHALIHFQLDVSGQTAVDIGAS